uniref:DUF4276 family protein n=1 Tax=Candidatus Kentrum sp. FW TaxID=2126338 RepID=A0A450TQ05_9GAMM|nr:MAG: protein of unknown function (DUF4276) [Candidatus Kentron sp. FW]
MIRVVVIVEGKTEVLFIKQILAPELASSVQLYPQTLNTSRRFKGGDVGFERLRSHAKNTLSQSSGPILTTFLDLYGLRTDFPAFRDIGEITDPLTRVTHLEEALHEAIVNESDCRPERFIPHIQPFEFEGLLFSDVDALCAAEPGWERSRATLTGIRDASKSPEHINDSYDTKPSKRLEDILSPKYRKTLHGPLAAKNIGLAMMERECAHFRQWMDRLRRLAG